VKSEGSSIEGRKLAGESEGGAEGWGGGEGWKEVRKRVGGGGDVKERVVEGKGWAG